MYFSRISEIGRFQFLLEITLNVEQRKLKHHRKTLMKDIWKMYAKRKTEKCKNYFLVTYRSSTGK